MSGYLGKISAIVSANTADFDNKLNKSASEVRKFASSIQGSLTAAQNGSSAALRGIYTDAQKLERALRAVSTGKLSFKGFQEGNLQAAADKMRAIYSAAEQVNKPLASAVKGFQKLSTAVQGEFNAALIGSQTSVERLAGEIDRTAGSADADFSRLADRLGSVARQVEFTTQAMGRLKEASAMVSGLATGQELRFQRPEMVAEMQRSAALQSQAAQMSPEAIARSGAAGLVSQQRAAAEETERLAAALERERLLVNGNVEAASSAYRSQLAAQREINSELERRIRLEASVGGGSDAGLGLEIGDSRRQLDVLRGTITSLKSQIDALPTPLQARLVPAIQDAENEFRQLVASGTALPVQIEAARTRLTHLTQEATRATAAMNFSTSFGGAGETGIALGLDQRALQGYNAQLQILQRYMVRIPAEANGPAVAAFNNLRNAIAGAINDGTANTTQGRQRIAALTQDAVRATAALAGVSGGWIAREMARAGDVGRMGFDRFSLAVNQAAFAIDDLMSSTGGVEFRLRAISNNITQLAFMAGGTTGLIVGLGVVMAAQASIALMKWANGGKTAEDQTKALNDALSKQKTLVEGVADAFKSLNRELLQGTVTERGGKAMEFAELGRKQKEAREDAIANGSRDVAASRAEAKRIQRELEAETTQGRRAVLEQQLKAAQAEEQRAARRAAATPAPTGQDVAAAARNSADAVVGARNSARTGATTAQYILDRFFSSSSAGRINAVGGQVAQGSDLNAIRAQIEALKNVNKELAVSAGRRVFGFETGESQAADRRMAKNAELLAQLEGKVAEATDAAVSQFAESLGAAAAAVRAAQGEVTEAIKAGIPEARIFASEVEAIGRLLNEAESDFAAAQKEADNQAKSRREEIAKSKRGEAFQRRDDLIRQTDALRYERMVEPQRQTEAVAGRARGNLGAAGLEDGVIARRLRELEASRVTLQADAAAPDAQSMRAQAGFQKIEAALNQEAAAIESATLAVKVFAGVLGKASEEAKGNLAVAQQAADDARRADLGFSTPKSRETRRRADADLERQKELERRVQEEIEIAIARREQAGATPEARRLREINERLNGGSVQGVDRDALLRERSGIRARMEADARRNEPGVRNAVNAGTQEEERRKMARRGEELATTPDQKFAKETAEGLAAMRESFGRYSPFDIAGQRTAEQRYMREREKESRTQTLGGRGRETFLTEQERYRRGLRDPDGIVAAMTQGAIDQAGAGNLAGRRDLLRKGISNQMEEAAPMLKQLDDQRKNALMLGPSRAALSASDITTGQGASELTRLLRGDDASRDQNLVELQKQTQKFDALIEAVRQANPGVLL